MESYHGYIRTPADAILLVQACYNGLLPRIEKRLSPKEGRSIRNGSIFIWEEHETGLRRWTDGRKWSPSRVSGRFLIYREMEGMRGDSPTTQSVSEADTTSSSPCEKRDFRSVVGIEDPQPTNRPKPQLMKLSFSIVSPGGHHWHLINYYHQHQQDSPSANELRQPITDPALKHVYPQRDLFPLSLVNDRQNFAIFSREPKLVKPAPVESDQPCRMCGSASGYRQILHP